MPLPTPSFFRIRLILVLFIVLVFCFLIGFVKDVLADSPGYVFDNSPCKHEVIVYYNQSSYSYAYQSKPGAGFDIYFSDHKEHRIYKHRVSTIYWDGTSWQDSGIGVFWFYKEILPDSFDLPVKTSDYEQVFGKCNDGDKCAAKAIKLTQMCGGVEDVAWHWTDKEKCYGMCINPCASQQEALIQQCGHFGWEWVNEEQCQGKCLDPCEAEKKRLEALCTDGGWEWVDEENCTGQCSCPSLGKKFNYYTPVFASDKTKKPDSPVTCIGGCLYSLGDFMGFDVLSDTAYYFSRRSVGQECSNLNYDTGEGTETSDGKPIIPFKAPDKEDPLHAASKGPDLSPPDPVTPAPNAPDNPNNPSNPDLKAIKSNLDKIIAQNNNLNAISSENKSIADWQAENQKLTVDNLKIIGDKLSKGVSLSSQSISMIGSQIKGVVGGVEDGLDDISDNLSGVEDGINGLSDELSEIGEGLEGLKDGLGDISGGNYSPPSPLSNLETGDYSWEDRTNQFFSDMRNTGIFSFPSQLGSSIPGGGSPIIQINGGETFGGTHSIDYSKISSAIIILRYIFMIASSIIAIRIVTLHR